VADALRGDAHPTVSLRTVVVFHLGGEGGPARSLLPALTALAERGRVETIVPAPGPVAEAYSRVGPVTVKRYGALTFARKPRQAMALLRDTLMFRRTFRERRPDLVVVVTTTLPAALVAARLAGIPAVVYAAELYEQEWKRSRSLRVYGALLSRVVARLARAIVCCSALVARQFDAGPGTPVVVAYPPIGIAYAAGDRDRGRARYELETAAPCLAAVGALSRGRGQDVALRALAIVRERFPAARLVLVGEPHPRAIDITFADELHSLARDLGITDAVVFAGATDAVADVYAAADIVLNPARFAEPFGRVAAEALVAGRPVVAARVGALEEVVRADVDGLLVAPDEPRALADGVIRLWENPGLRDRLVTAGRERVLVRFTEAANLAAWDEAFGALPGEPRRPR
jgi:glycosyltransferase involved in cell wall biosynthesis